jgi:hypothetical protein
MNVTVLVISAVSKVLGFDLVLRDHRRSRNLDDVGLGRSVNEVSLT